GNEPWTITNQYTYEGYYSAKSGNIGSSKNSELILTLETMFADSISFIRKVSSAAGHSLKFYINNTLKDEWSGTSEGWKREAYYVGIGNYTFRWEYKKTGGSPAGSDCAWLDYIIMPPIMTLTCYAGPDDIICEDEDYQCNGDATDWVSVEWTTSGTGTFDDNTILDPVYTPSGDDITAGSAILTLEAIDSDGEVVDAEMTFTIDYAPEAPEMPSGPDYVDVFLTDSSEYTITPLASANSYVWDIDPNEAGTISGNGTSSIVYWDDDYLGYAYISVKGVNNCGEGEYSDGLEVTVNNTTSTPENENNKISVYPNPTSGKLNIEWISGNFDNVKIEIINMLGTQVYHENNIQGKGAYQHTINLDELSKGVYFLIIKGDNIHFNKKIIIQK
ncbi:T9SS type A sorting domain-containing protein, partial [Candidatus Dependentiae bacterium]|nr:T9SS type A sorting domain-containing protein [Candidatus Dependentiae bacterium]